MANAQPQTITGLTAADLADLPTGMGERYELIEGKLITLSPAKPIPGFVAQRIASILDAYNDKTEFGTQFTAETGFRTRKDDRTVRAPDVSLFSYKRLPMETLNDLGHDFLTVAPELVVEVVSDNDRANEIAQKTREWLDFGVQLVLNVYPDTQQVYRHTPEGIRVLEIDDTLDGGEALPGFQVAIKTFFSKRKQEN